MGEPDRKRRRRTFTRRLKRGENFSATANGATVRVWWRGKRVSVQLSGRNPRHLSERTGANKVAD